MPRRRLREEAGYRPPDRQPTDSGRYSPETRSEPLQSRKYNAGGWFLTFAERLAATAKHWIPLVSSSRGGVLQSKMAKGPTAKNNAPPPNETPLKHCNNGNRIAGEGGSLESNSPGQNRQPTG